MFKKIFVLAITITFLAMFTLLKVEGTPDGWDDEIRITFDGKLSINPKIAISGEFKYIVWADDRDDNYEIYIEKLDEFGRRMWNNKRLTLDGRESDFPSLAIDSNNNIHIVWHDDRNGNYTIYYKKIEPNNAVPLIDDTQISNLSGWSLYPNIAIDSNDNIHIVWQNDGSMDNEIYYEKLDNDGNTLIDDLRLTFNTYESNYPSLAIDSNNNIHIVWHDDRDMGNEIYYEKLNNNGGTLIDDLRITTNDGETSEQPSIAVDLNDNIYISWQDTRDFNYEIYYEKLNNNGGTLIDERRITYNGYNSITSSIAIDNNNFVHITWSDDRNFNWEIYFKKLDDKGNTLINDLRLTEDPSNRDSSYPSIFIDNGNNSHIVWQDDRDDNWEIYYKKSFNEEKPTAIIEDISPNPGNKGENIYFRGNWSDIGGGISAYEWKSNIDGNLSNLKDFSNSSLSPGTHNISFRVRDDYGVWSDEVYATLFINIRPNAFIDNISPNSIIFGEQVNFTGHGEDIDGNIVDYEWTSSLDGFLSNLSSFSNDYLSIGNHRIYFRVMDNNSAWSDYNISYVEVRDPPNKPDFKIVSSDISFSNNAPYEGDWITINALIGNIGNWKGKGDIAFYDGDPRSTGILIFIKNNVTIEKTSSALVSALWKTTIGSHEIYVRIENVIPRESSTANNMNGIGGDPKKTIMVSAFPENTKLRGRVYDSYNNSLNISNANILVKSIDGKIRNTISDMNGYYELFVFSGYNIVYFSADSYLNYHIFINITKDEIRWLNSSLYHSPPIISKIYGYIKDENGNAIESAEIEIHNTYYKNTETSYSSTNGYYEIYTYNNNFIFTVKKDGYEVIIEEITVLGNINISKTLQKENKTEIITNAIFSDWNNLSAITEITLYRNKEIKYMIDVWYGNGDGILSIEEFEVWRKIFLPINFVEDSNKTFQVNDIYYNLINSNIVYRNNTGNIIDINPLTIIIYQNFTSSQQIIGEEYKIKLNATYENQTDDHIIYLSLVKGYILKNYSASNLIKIESKNSNITINTNEGNGYEWILLNITLSYNLTLLKELEDKEFDEDTSIIAFDLDDYFYKKDTILIYNFTGNLNVYIDIDAENKVRFSSKKDWFGEENITFIATDGIEIINYTIKVKVRPINDKPIVELQENITVRQDIAIWIPITITDVDDPLENITVSISNDFVSYEKDNSTLKFLYPKDGGSGLVTIIVSDGKTSTIVKINVTFIPSSNIPPEILILTPTEGKVVNDVVIIEGVVSDVDKDKNIIVEMKIDDGEWFKIPVGIGGNWKYIWDTTKVSNGEHKITVRAYDGKNYSKEFSITLKVENKAPAPPWFIPYLEIIYLIGILVIISYIYRKFSST